MATNLSRQAFLALAAVAWADGRLRRDEAEALRRAAEESGVPPDEARSITDAAERGISIDELDFRELNGWERAVTYAFAVWLAELDGVVSTSELAGLRELGQRLELPPQKLESARSAVFDVACLPGGHRPERYDFAALEGRLREKLPALFRASMPPAKG